MKNAVEKRIDQLAELWTEFAEDPQARILRWLVTNDEVNMIDAFIEVQNAGGEIPDLFVPFDDPFSEPKQHGFTLRESLINKYQEICSEVVDDPDIPTDWTCPSLQPTDSGVEAFVQASASLRQYYDGLMVHLVLALLPQNFEAIAWQNWLRELLTTDVPPYVRFMIVDHVESPVLDSLCDVEPVRVTTIKPELDMPGAYAELVRDVPGAGPGFDFRKLFVALTTAAGKGNIQQAQQAADRAMKIATEQNWPQMQVATYMALGAAYLSSGDSASALASYRDANQAVEGSDDPAAPKLVIQTRFAEAAVLVRDQDFAEAAKIYEALGPLLEQQKDDTYLWLESWRMAAFCHEKSGQLDAAWECGHRALDVGEKLDGEKRSYSTLPYVAQGLLQLTSSDLFSKHTDELQQRLDDLLGLGWEKQLPEGRPLS